MNNEQIVNSIKNLCKNSNITITKLEEAIGLSQGLISRWTKSEPSLSKIIDIADYFGVSLDEVVGYKCANLGDIDFIKKLKIQTDDETLKWKEDSIYESELFPLDNEYFTKSQLDKRKPRANSKTYSTVIYPTTIAIIARSNDNCIEKPEEIKLYIQPDRGSKFIAQNYSTKQLSQLWFRVLLSLKENAPDEIKAKEFINSFLADKDNNTPMNYIEIQSLNKNDYFSKSKEYLLEYLINTINSNEFRKMQETFSNPDFQAAIQKIKEYKED